MKYIIVILLFLSTSVNCNNIDNEIEKYCSFYNLDKYIVYGIIKKESWYEIKAIKNDKNVLIKQKWFINALTLYSDNIQNETNYCSLGLMQILYINARYLGYKGNFSGLYNVSTNIKYGCKLLEKFYTQYNNWNDAISAYNIGHLKYYDINNNGKKEANELYYNQIYVNKVISNSIFYRSIK